MNCAARKCKNQAVESKQKCQIHLDLDVETVSKSRQRRVDQGICKYGGCLEPLVSGKESCQKHLDLCRFYARVGAHSFDDYDEQRFRTIKI